MAAYNFWPEIDKGTHEFEDYHACPAGSILAAGLLKTAIRHELMRVMVCYGLVYNTRGVAIYEDAAGAKIKMLPGDLAVLFPGFGHRYGPPPGETWDQFYFLFTGSAFDHWRDAGLLTPGKPIYHLEPVDYWHQRFRDIIAPGLSQLQRVCAMQQTLADAIASSAKEQSPTWLDQAKELLSLVPVRTPVTVARELGQSYESFRKDFVRFVGTPPGRYQSARVMAKACRLLSNRSLRVHEVAAQLQFCDAYHFSRRFKKVMGVSPAQFRRGLPHAE